MRIMPMDSGCWYCGKPTLEVWHTTWDVDGQEWPMCEECAGAVRSRLDLRARGLTAEADLGDEQHGIDTRGIAGRWIYPKKMLE